MTEYTFDQLIDLAQVRRLLESHHRLSGMAYGLFDSAENNLIAVGWQEICVRFHRVNSVTATRCRAANAYLLRARLPDFEEEYLEHHCGNGMVDVAMPIVISGKHQATFYAGQFFYDDDRPDTAFFRRQAEELGFDGEDYLAALERVPMFSREYVRDNIRFLGNMVNVLSEMGLKNLRFAEEIEEHKNTERQLRDTRGRLSAVFTTIPDMVWLKNREGVYLACNPAFEKFFGAAEAEIAGKTDHDFVDAELADFFIRKDREAMAASRVCINEEEITYAADGRRGLLETRKMPVYGPDGQISGVLGIARDITEVRKVEQTLNTKQEQLGAVVRELSKAEERERLRIASVLHDHIGQTLLLGRIKLGALAGINKPAPVGSAIDEVMELLDQATDDAHSLTVQLNPPMLSMSGLEAALQWLGRRMETDYGLVVEFSDDRLPKGLDDELNSILYQCARELLINTAKHANTDRAWISIAREDGMCRLSVEDRGAGFHPDDIVPDISRDCRFGLFSIKLRIERLGGSMEIESSPGNGAGITIRLPIAVERNLM
ncbi:MAG: hypothetical protein A2X80_05550 [Geobacteraceae bacterium GWB2_52_12]|nr:MAG: hypothetical protein A2X80_05550 [Geobacteraceae bacterium GWB2_52_12]